MYNDHESCTIKIKLNEPNSYHLSPYMANEYHKIMVNITSLVNQHAISIPSR